jgi:hypothetical protein
MNLFEIDMIQSGDLLDVSDQSLIVNTFQFDMCVYIHVITVIDKVLLRKEVRQKGTD